jgi:hypothetical protein
MERLPQPGKHLSGPFKKKRGHIRQRRGPSCHPFARGNSRIMTTTSALGQPLLTIIAIAAALVTTSVLSY